MWVDDSRGTVDVGITKLLQAQIPHKAALVERSGCGAVLASPLGTKKTSLVDISILWKANMALHFGGISCIDPPQIWNLWNEIIQTVHCSEVDSFQARSRGKIATSLF